MSRAMVCSSGDRLLLRRYRARAAVPMDAGAVDQVHADEPLRALPRWPPEGSGRDAEATQRPHRGGSAGGARRPGVSQPVRITRGLEDAECRQEDGGSRVHCPVHARARRHHGGGRGRREGARDHAGAQPDGHRPAPGGGRHRRRRLRGQLELRRQQARALHPDHHQEWDDRGRRGLLARPHRRDRHAGRTSRTRTRRRGCA